MEDGSSTELRSCVRKGSFALGDSIDLLTLSKTMNALDLRERVGSLMVMRSHKYLGAWLFSDLNVNSISL